jgi:sulfane dehydrogenase subunit SoxC
VLTHPYGRPSPFEAEVRRRALPGRPGLYTPLHQLSGSLTPSGLMFEFSRGNWPSIDPAEFRLRIDGLISQPLQFNLTDLKLRPAQVKIAFVECDFNGSERDAATLQFSHGRIGNCEWSGVRLADLVAGLDISDSARWLIARSADGTGYARAIPIAQALADAILVYAQNGEMLRPEHGYPLRLLLPGLGGASQVKWCHHIEFVAEADAPQVSPPRPVNSVITRPAAGLVLGRHGYFEIRGLAWSGAGVITRVDVAVDSAEHWQRATLQEPVLEHSLVRFTLPWFWRGVATTMVSRAFDDTGAVQPLSGASNAVQHWVVSAQGEVRAG